MAKAARKPARKKGASRNTSRKSGGAPGALWLVLGLLLGLTAAFAWYLWDLRQHRHPAESTASAGKDDAEHRAGEGKEKGKGKGKAAKPADDEGRFEFYTLLPKQEVMPGKKTAPTRSESKSAQDQSYLLQAGSFKSEDEADKRRASLLLLGLPVKVVRVPGDEDWFRVVVGPFKTTAEVDAARSSLKGSGVEAILLKRG